MGSTLILLQHVKYIYSLLSLIYPFMVVVNSSKILDIIFVINSYTSFFDTLTLTFFYPVFLSCLLIYFSFSPSLILQNIYTIISLSYIRTVRAVLLPVPGRTVLSGTGGVGKEGVNFFLILTRTLCK